MNNLKNIKSVLSDKKYFLIFVLAAIIYILIYYWQISRTAGTFLSFVKAYTHWYVYTSIPLAATIAVLTGITFALFAAKLEYVKGLKPASASSAGGIFAGLLASGCPGCVAGTFPFIMSLFGISATLGSLPFGGLELQLLSVLLLTVSIYYLSQPNVCKTK